MEDCGQGKLQLNWYVASDKAFCQGHIVPTHQVLDTQEWAFWDTKPQSIAQFMVRGLNVDGNEETRQMWWENHNHIVLRELNRKWSDVVAALKRHLKVSWPVLWVGNRKWAYWQLELTLSSMAARARNEMELGLKDFPERNGLYVLPPPQETNEGRKNYKVYWWFCLHFMEAAVGSTKWKQCKASQTLHKIVTPSRLTQGSESKKPNCQIVGMQEKVDIWIRDSVVGHEKA